MNGCRHGWRWDSRWNGDGPPPVPGCSGPSLLVCDTCQESTWVRCDSTRDSVCSGCAAAYRGRVGVVAGSGLRVGRSGLFLTLTAPGHTVHTLPSGAQCPCTPADVPLDERGGHMARWNGDSARRWNRFVQALRRLLGDDVPVEYFKGVEVQRRGAVHFHVLMRRADGLPLALTTSAVRRLAIAHGFGHAVDVQAVQPGHAGYVAKYVSKAADSRKDVPWSGWSLRGGKWTAVDVHTGEITETVKARRRVKVYRPTYRTWSASRGWGDPMARVRLAQAHYVLVMDALPTWGDRPGGPCRDAGASVVPPAAAYGNGPPPGGGGRAVLAGAVPV